MNMFDLRWFFLIIKFMKNKKYFFCIIFKIRDLKINVYESLQGKIAKLTLEVHYYNAA